MTGFPRFETARRLRPVTLVGSAQISVEETTRPASYSCPRPAPSAAVEADCAGPMSLRWASGDVVLTGTYDGRAVFLDVTTGARTTRHRSRRWGRVGGAPEALALTLTGAHLTAFTRTDGAWTARARVDLADRVDTRDEAWLAGLEVGCDGPVGRLRAGSFGQLGLRDLRIVSEPDGAPWLVDGRLLLTATSAGPGFFDTAHTSVWELDPDTLDLAHRSDLFFRRDGRVYGDHATHLLRDPSPDGDGWLVATSTWGDFDAALPGARVGVTLARSSADLLAGEHVLDATPLALPTAGRSVGVWDPHLVRADGGWLVGYVSAKKFFDFHPVLAGGPSLDRLALRGAAMDRRATEGTTLVRLDGSDGTPADWRVLASDGRDNPAPHRAAYPVFDLGLRQLGTLDAPYPSNIPWPTLARVGERWLLVGFDATPEGGGVLGYGTHGTVVISTGQTSLG